MKRLKTFIFGLTYGIASPIPGVDGGTLFILFNAYEDFILSANFSNMRKKLPYLLLFGIGCALGLFGISRLLLYLLEHYEKITYFAFVGLIIGLIPIIYQKSALNINKYKLEFKNVMICLISFIILFCIIMWQGEGIINIQLYQLYENPILLLAIFIAAALAAIGMLVPGVGGAIIMLLLGIYSIYLEAVANLEWMVLLTLILGMAVGILSGIKIIRRLLINHGARLYCAILGFTSASVFVVFPGFSFNTHGLIALIIAIFFGFIAYKFSIKGNKNMHQ